MTILNFLLENGLKDHDISSFVQFVADRYGIDLVLAEEIDEIIF